MLCEQSATPNTNERRRHKRYRCPLPIEITSPDFRFPVRGETSDVSLSGCYINTMMPLPKGVSINVCLSIDGTEITTAASVRTSDQAVGNGIEFIDPGEIFCQVLQAKLEQIQRLEDESQAS